MNSFVKYISDLCLRNQIITSEQCTWFEYCLEKRISSILVSIPFFILATIMSDVYVAFAFFVCFYLIRTKANGFHARTVWGCFILSIIHVIAFIGVLYPLLDAITLDIIAFVGVSIIWLLAPFDSPEMHLSDTEKATCRTSSRMRSCGILVCGFILQALGVLTIAKGLFLGIAMAAYLLCLAYIFKWRITK